jgi:di/tricarboxylate transporter
MVDQVLVFGSLLFIVVSLYKNFFRPGTTFLISVIFLGALRVLSPNEILHGFSNQTLMVILMLLLLGDVFQCHNFFDGFFRSIFRKTKTYKGFIGRMFLIIAPFSAFLNNTPLVAFMMPYIHTWSKKNNKAVSKLLMPLSYIAILGGCITLVGTSTHLITNGLITDQTVFPNHPPIGMFDFVPVALPMAVLGFFYIYFFGNKMLPDRINTIEDFSQNTRKFIVEAQLKENGSIVGKTIAEAGLRNLDNLYLFKILRNKEEITVNPKETILHKGDHLLFTGNTQGIASLIDQHKGLEIPSVGMFSHKKERNIVEVVISHNSSLVNRTLKNENFRAKYDATAIAIHRNGEQLNSKLGTSIIKPGDSILLLAGGAFKELIANVKDFYLISEISPIQKSSWNKALVIFIGLMLVFTLSTVGVMSLFTGLMVLLVLAGFLQLTNWKQIIKRLDFDLALVIAMAMALGIAMDKTGVAHSLSQTMVRLSKPFGIPGLLIGFYFLTSVLSAFVTNKAAVAIVIPVVLTFAKEASIDPLPFVLLVSLAAAANFMTPIGYQTNTMIYGPGGYRFKDFMRFGLPLTLLYMIGTITTINYLYF